MAYDADCDNLALRRAVVVQSFTVAAREDSHHGTVTVVTMPPSTDDHG
jgi:hypothetical protein